MLMLPELFLIGTAFVVLLVDLFIKEKQRTILAPLAIAGLIIAGTTLVISTPQTGELLGGRFALDPVGWWFKVFFILAAAVTVAISMDLFDSRVAAPLKDLAPRGEFYTILLFTVAGMMYLVSARDLVTLYVSLELATIPLFALTAWRRNEASGEAGLKYLIVGALASGLLLYGFSLLYGLTGQTGLAAIAQALTFTPAFWLAAAMVTAGVGFKMTIVPFHFWAAEVYQGAPTPVTAYLSVASKAAGLAFMFQLFFRVLGQYLGDWALALAIISAVTMTAGNAIAIVQQNIKRFMAFSGISQAGYLLLGFLGVQGATHDGVAAMLFYMLVYIITNLTIFGVIMFHSNATGREEINDYKGLSRTNPLMALAMMIALFGLSGIPPLSGFVGKFFLFSVASKAGYHWLVALAAVNSTVSLYYYLRVIRQMYIEAPGAKAKSLPASPVLGLTVGTLAVASVVLGVVPMFYQAIRSDTAGWLELLARM